MKAIDPQPDLLQNHVQNFQMTTTSSCPRSTSSYWRPCCPNIIHTLWLVGHLPKLSQCAGDVCFMFQLFKISFPRVLAFFTSRPYTLTHTRDTNHDKGRVEMREVWGSSAKSENTNGIPRQKFCGNPLGQIHYWLLTADAARAPAIAVAHHHCHRASQFR